MEVCGTKSFIARMDTPTIQLSAVGSMTAKMYRNGNVQTVPKSLSFWYLLASAVICYYILQISLPFLSRQYSILNKVVVCHVERVENLSGKGLKEVLL